MLVANDTSRRAGQAPAPLIGHQARKAQRAMERERQRIQTISGDDNGSTELSVDIRDSYTLEIPGILERRVVLLSDNTVSDSKPRGRLDTGLTSIASAETGIPSGEYSVFGSPVSTRNAMPAMTPRFGGRPCFSLEVLATYYPLRCCDIDELGNGKAWVDEVGYEDTLTCLDDEECERVLRDCLREDEIGGLQRPPTDPVLLGYGPRRAARGHGTPVDEEDIVSPEVNMVDMWEYVGQASMHHMPWSRIENVGPHGFDFTRHIDDRIVRRCLGDLEIFAKQQDVSTAFSVATSLGEQMAGLSADAKARILLEVLVASFEKGADTQCAYNVVISFLCFTRCYHNIESVIAKVASHYDDFVLDHPYVGGVLIVLVYDLVRDGFICPGVLARFPRKMLIDFARCPSKFWTSKGIAIRLRELRDGTAALARGIASYTEVVLPRVHEWQFGYRSTGVKQLATTLARAPKAPSLNLKGPSGSADAPLGSFHHLFVYEVVRIGLTARSDTCRSRVSDLLSYLVGEGVISGADVEWGLWKIMGRWDDLALDTPWIETLLFKFVLKAVADEIVPPLFLGLSCGLNFGQGSATKMLRKACDVVCDPKLRSSRLLNVWELPHAMVPDEEDLDLIHHIMTGDVWIAVGDQYTPDFVMGMVFEQHLNETWSAFWGGQNRHELWANLSLLDIAPCNDGAAEAIKSLISYALERCVGWPDVERNARKLYDALNAIRSHGLVAQYDVARGVIAVETSFPELEKDLPFAGPLWREMRDYLRGKGFSLDLGNLRWPECAQSARKHPPALPASSPQPPRGASPPELP